MKLKSHGQLDGTVVRAENLGVDFGIGQFILKAL